MGKRIAMFARRMIIAWVTLCLGVSMAEDSNAQDADPRDWVYVIDAKTPKLTGGSLTYVGSEHDYAYFVTCYHVLHQAKTFEILARGRSQHSKTFATHNDVRIVADSKHDLVLIEIPLEKFAPGDLPKNGALHKVLKDEQDASGVAIGYSFLGRSYRLLSPVDIWGGKNGSDLRTADNRVLMPNPDPKRPVFFRYLHRVNTIAGMSGGPVAAEDPLRFAGIICARIHDTQGLCISASSIQELYAKRKEAKTFKVGTFQEKIAFARDTIGFHSAEFVDLDQKRWESFEEWGLLLDTGDQPRQFLGSFQEVRRDLAAYSTKQVGVARTIDLKTNEGCEVWLNGVRVTNHRLNLVPGENLIAIRKSQKREGWSLNDLMAANELAVNLQEDDVEFLKIRRSLPAVVENYSIFLTLTNGEPNHHFPVNIESSWGEPEMRQVPPNLVPLLEHLESKWQIEMFEPRTRSQARGLVKLDKRKDILWRPVSSQTIDLELPLRIKVDVLRLRAFGLDAKLPETKEDLEITVWFRFQLVTNGANGKPQLSGRALAGWMQTPLSIPLLASEDNAALSVDLRAIFSQLFVAYLNRDHFRPEGAGNFDIQSIALKAAGVDLADESRFVAAILGIQPIPEFKDPRLKIRQLSVTGSNQQFDIASNGTLEVAALTRNKFTIRSANISFTLHLNSDKQPGQLGTIYATFESGTLEYINDQNEKIAVKLKPASVAITIASDGTIKTDKSVDDLGQKLLGL